ncbi:CRISPR-associated Csh2 family protein [Anaerobacterium chartisolvens]|uniref:CRISPR-associated Csh2 family protein n=1 Tax=Anaerobacterium chartisolvens TaxID=1297424 RepID=A0A369B3Z8_9FIRM|nr:type I-B CRISPR-associated protein Cas7/Csh2 [Anaerobacterium chartisolvens]RCX16262.1 CRISPR-associated Csh2 family protein [Anaerobacterium chartisolvens]
MINSRQEILFIYDVTDANPNGDPLDENKPRIDEETGINIVTDVRLKRTIRDYLYSYKGFDGKNGKDIFVREVESDKGGIKDGKARARDFGEKAGAILENAIDIRLFGGVIPLPEDSITFTGPVQFNMGRSLNRVTLTHMKGTGAFASKEGAGNKTFRDEYILPYSLIAFHGIVNENAARETQLQESDVELMQEALWMGTKNLITRSKMGHMPRMMIRVVYKKDNFFIGELQKKIKISSLIEDEKIRGPEDFVLDVGKLLEELSLHSEKIEKVIFIADKALKLVSKGEEVDLNKIESIRLEEAVY